jgi:transposase-like protein
MLQSNHDGAGGRVVERAEGEHNAAATGSSTPNGVPDPELVDRPTRRRFSAEYKVDILRKADACGASGEIAALLRSEGLYSSHLATWRKQREAGSLAALSTPRGRKAPDPLIAENAKLLRRAEHAESDLAKARKVIEIQGNVLALSEQLLSTEDAGHPGSTGR